MRGRRRTIELIEARPLQVVEELVERGEFNGINFCLTCMVRLRQRADEVLNFSSQEATGRCRADVACAHIHVQVRRPLRSKHSFATDRCVAKFDQLSRLLFLL